MTLETVSSDEYLNCIIYDTISATPCNGGGDCLETSLLPETVMKPQNHGRSCSLMTMTRRQRRLREAEAMDLRESLGRKKRRRKARVCKNKEEAETQRMTHITVERNRRKQMNEHLAVLRSLMPKSYVHKGDQASIVGGAIEFVKELEHLLQSLEAEKMKLLRRGNEDGLSTASKFPPLSPFSQFFLHPQYTWSLMPNKNISKNTASSVADIEVTLIETHASLRILLGRRSPKQLLKLVSGFQSLCLNILHINVTTMDSFVLYSISAKVEEECQLSCVDDIAGAVHHVLRIIEEEAALLC